ncbi:MAG: Abi family protein [Candidatus Limisoma sp.]
MAQLVFDAIEKIEVSIRTNIVYTLSHKYGSHWQDDESIYKPEQHPRIYNADKCGNMYRETLRDFL